MTRLCTYVVRRDAGLAPNPYWGYCTLAVCTPNHQGTRLSVGDWIAGCLNKARGHRLLYVMEISEILGLNDYYRDRRFERKKPNLRGTWQERCGDNFYSQKSDGTWVQHRNRFHLDEAVKAQDTRHARVFIGQNFWYLGNNAKLPPSRFSPLFGGRGARVNHEPKLSNGFTAWVKTQLEMGISGQPNDNPDMDS